MLDILRMDVTKDLLRKMAKEERCLFRGSALTGWGVASL
jgi:hypothetical protein